MCSPANDIRVLRRLPTCSWTLACGPWSSNAGGGRHRSLRAPRGTGTCFEGKDEGRMKKKDRSLGKLYDRLTLDERVKLAIQAKARRDAEDTQRLTESCPTETYTMNDIAFGDHISGNWKITMMLCHLLAPSLARLHTIAAVREFLPQAFDHCIS